MDRVLVTGGAGFIGANFVRHVVEHTDARVTVLDKLTYAASPEALADLPADRVELVVGDVADAATVDPLVAAHDTVVHLAAESHNDNSLDDPEPFIRTNVVGTYVLLEAVRKHRRPVPPRLDRRGVRRPRARRPQALHRGHAVPAEQPLLRRQGRLRPPGAGLGAQLRRARDASPTAPTTTAPGSTSRSSSRARSPRCSRAAGRASTATAGRCATGSTSTTTARRPAERSSSAAGSARPTWSAPTASAPTSRWSALLLRLMGRPEDDVELVADRAGHDQRYAIESGKLRLELGWQPRFGDFEQGLAETIDWYTDHRDWWGPHKAAPRRRTPPRASEERRD